MAKAWIVQRGEYSDREVIGVFTTQAALEARARWQARDKELHGALLMQHYAVRVVELDPESPSEEVDEEGL